MQQRLSAPDAEAVVAAAVVEAATSEPWKIEPLPSEQWPRFLVRFAPQQEDAGRREYEMLVSEGFDARYDEQKGIEVIASAVNLTALLHRGYQLYVIRDLLSGEDAGGH